MFVSSKLKLIKTLYCASLLRMIFAPLAHAHEGLHVHNIADLLENPNYDLENEDRPQNTIRMYLGQYVYMCTFFG